MWRVGLTGGIASGKSTVAALFEELGAALVDADLLAREVVAPNSPGLTAIVRLFGADLVDADGRLDRARLRRRVFSDRRARRALEQLLHPLIGERMRLRMQALDDSRAPYAIVVIPLLIETAQHSAFDRLLVVHLPAEVQLARLLGRDGGSAAQARAIIASQAHPGRRLALADDVVDNSGEPSTLRAQVAALDRRYRCMAAARD